MVGYLGQSVGCDWGLSGGQQSVLQAIGCAGSLVGLYLFGAAADAAGRRPTILASAVLQCAFGAASAAAPNYGSLLFFRFAHGVAVSGALTAIILFAEMVGRERCANLCDGSRALTAVPAKAVPPQRCTHQQA